MVKDGNIPVGNVSINFVLHTSGNKAFLPEPFFIVRAIFEAAVRRMK